MPHSFCIGNVGYRTRAVTNGGQPRICMPPAKPRQFLLNSSVEPSSPNFLPGTPHFYYTHSIRRRFVSILRITLGKNHIFLSLPEVFCDPKICQECVSGRGSYPGPRWGSSRRSPRILFGCGGDTPSLLSGKLSVGTIKSFAS